MKKPLGGGISHGKKWCDIVYFYNRFFRKSARIDLKCAGLENLGHLRVSHPRGEQFLLKRALCFSRRVFRWGRRAQLCSP